MKIKLLSLLNEIDSKFCDWKLKSVHAGLKGFEVWWITTCNDYVPFGEDSVKHYKKCPFCKKPIHREKLDTKYNKNGLYPTRYPEKYK